MGLSLDAIDPPLDDIAFLSRSNHRVDALQELADGGRTRRELREATGTSQPTIGRVLDGFRERGWIAADGDAFVLTPLGRVLTDAFTDLMDTVRTVQDLHELDVQLPFDEVGFDLESLTEARITTPSQGDATKHVRREQELAERAERVRFFCNSAHPHTVAVYRDRVVEDGQRLEAVIAGEALGAAADDSVMRGHLHDLLASDRTTIYRYDGVVDVMLGILGDTAVIQPLDEAGNPRAIIDTDDQTIVDWVADRLASYRSEAEEITPETLLD